LQLEAAFISDARNLSRQFSPISLLNASKDLTMCSVVLYATRWTVAERQLIEDKQAVYHGIV
jgi:hypothetical protein